jgi:N-acetylneuraminic acid mutarotase
MRRLLPLLLAGLLVAGFHPARSRAQGWVEVESMPTPRAYAAVAVLDGQIYVMGGRDANGNPLGTVERYDPVQDEWQTVARLRDPRYNAAATVLGGRILLTGGRALDDGQVVVTDDVEVYVPGEDDWESFDSIQSRREGHGAFTVANQAYVFGGSSPSGSFLDGCEYYDIGEEEWHTYAPWTLGIPRAAFASAAMSGGVLVFGGFSAFGPLTDVEFYVPGVGGVTKASMPDPPRGSLAGAGTETLAWAIGGKTYAGAVLDRVDVYDLVADRWDAGPALPEPREGAVAAVANGQVYVFGGQDGQGTLATTSLTTAVIPAVEDGLPGGAFALAAAGPNPFRDGTRLALGLDRPAEATVAVYDALGRRVAVLHDGLLPAGRHLLDWDGTDVSGRRLPSGLYVVRAVAGERQAALRLTLVR